ncbi:MAG: hypothetical protein KF749_07535 [Bacteroidetes bacterium]|nr:hypothetical protein [Bacteroidota bacterium]MCW5896837.1 hypothetical protein [Bacteroidota bacterium]
MILPNSKYVSSLVFERRTANQPYTRIAEVAGTVRVYTDTNVTANVAYTYRVSSVWQGRSTVSNEVTVTWQFAPPTNASVFVPMMTAGVGVSWATYSGLAAGFILERSANGSIFSEIARIPNNTRTAVDSTATPGNVYSYRVRSFTSRNVSEPSNIVRAQFLPIGLHTLPTKTLVGPTSSLAFSPDGSHWVSGAAGTCHVWSLGTSSQLLELQNPGITSVASSGAMVAVSGSTRSIACRFEPFGTLVITPAVRGNAITFSPDGAHIAACITQGVAISFSGSGAHVRTIAYDSTRSVAYRPDGTMVAAGADGGVGLWMAASGSLVRSIPIPGNTSIRVGFSSDGTKLVSGGTDGIVRIWDVVSGTEVLSWNAGEPITAFSVKGQKVITAGAHDARLWDLASGTIDLAFSGGTLIPTAVDISNNMRIIMVGYSNGTVKFWSLGNHWWPTP